MAELGKLLKDYPEYGKKAGDIVAVNYLIGGQPYTVRWMADSVGIAPQRTSVTLKIDKDVKLINEISPRPPKKRSPKIKPNTTVILLRDIEPFKKGQKAFAWIPIGSKPSIIKIYSAIEEDALEMNVRLGKDVEIINEQTPNNEQKPKEGSEAKSKPNWVLIGGIILVGYFLLKKK